MGSLKAMALFAKQAEYFNQLVLVNRMSGAQDRRTLKMQLHEIIYVAKVKMKKNI